MRQQRHLEEFNLIYIQIKFEVFSTHPHTGKKMNHKIILDSPPTCPKMLYNFSLYYGRPSVNSTPAGNVRTPFKSIGHIVRPFTALWLQTPIKISKFIARFSETLPVKRKKKIENQGHPSILTKNGAPKFTKN